MPLKLENFPCDVFKELGKKIYNIALEIENGVPMSRACVNNGISYMQFRRLTSFNFAENKNLNTNPIKNADKYESWEETLLSKITGDRTHVVVEGFEEALGKAMSTLTERQQEVIRLRYIEGLNLYDTGRKFNLSSQRVREIETKALRRLRHPNRLKYLLYGADTEYITEQEKETKALNDKIKEYKKRQDELIRALRTQELELYNEVAKLSEITQKAYSSNCYVRIRDMGLSTRSYKCLVDKGVKTIEDLAKLSKQDLLEIRNLGKKSADEIIRLLEEKYSITLK